MLSLRAEVLTESGMQASIPVSSAGNLIKEEDHIPAHEWARILTVGDYYNVQIEPLQPESDIFRARVRLDYWAEDTSKVKISLSFNSRPPELNGLLENTPQLPPEPTAQKVPRARKRFS